MKYALFAVLLLPLLAFKCVRPKDYIEVENQIGQNIFCLPGFNYPDTSLVPFEKDNILANDAVYFLRSAQKQRLFFEKFCVRSEWRKELAKDTLQLFVISEKTLKEVSWDSIRTNRLYLRRLIYTYTDIITSGCKITIQ